MIIGPAGSGKSWILGSLEELWRQNSWPSIKVSGDRAQSSRSFYPFHRALAANSSAMKRHILAKRSVAKTGTLVPFAGDLVEFIADTLLNLKERKQAAKSSFLNEEEQEILFEIQELAGKKPLLVVGDDFQYWDSESMALLKLFSNSDIQSAYPFTRYLRLVCAINSSFTSDISDYISGPGPDAIEWRLQYLRIDVLEAALREFGFQGSLPAVDLHAIYSATSGHLEIIKRLAEYLSQGSVITTTARSYRDILDELIEKRILRLGPDGLRLINLLEFASLTGTNISSPELNCLADSANDKTLISLLPLAIEMEFIKQESGQTLFTHEVVQQYFHGKTVHNPDIHAAFAECIGRLRPADYRGRAVQLYAANKREDANIFFFLEYLQSLRNGDGLVTERLDEICSTTNDQDRAEFYRKLSSSYKHYFTEKLQPAIGILERIEDVFHPALIAEKDYLWALCLKKSNLREHLVFAKRLLESWLWLKNSESEQWFRMVSLLMIIEANDGQFTEAKFHEREVVSYLSARINYDQFAIAGLNLLRRRCAALHPAEIATERCRSSASYFGPQEDGSTPRNPVQFYLSLSNLSGNLIMIGSYDEAITVAKHATSIAQEFSYARFPRPQIPINNLVVSATLAQSISSHSAIRFLEAAINSAKGIGEIILLANNCAVVKALAGRLYEASDDLGQMLGICRNDAYCSYFLASNFVSTKFLLNGDCDLGKKEWDELYESIPEVADKRFLVKRHQLQREAFDVVPVSDYLSWDNFLRERYPDQLGPVWKFYGRGFIFSDIQFWSES
jgi:hypothetical protein